MKILSIKSAKQTIYFGTDFLPAVDFLSRTMMPGIFIPCCQVKAVKNYMPSPKKVLISFVQSPNSKIKISENGERVVIFDDWSKSVPTYILSLISSLFQKQYLKHDLFSIHSSAVFGNTTNFIFIGKAGSGKTTTAIELVSRHQYKFLSNNRTVISADGLNIEAGTQSITVRNESIGSLDSFTEPHIENIYGRKVIRFRSKYLGNYRNNKKNIFIKLQLNPAVSEFKKMEFDESMIFLYPNLLDIYDREVLLFNWSVPAPISPLTIKDKKKALDLAHKIYNESVIYHLSGSLDFICEQITNLDSNE